ncbi:MAG: ribosome assembly cofactor RimP [Bacteroidales bacterium]
MIDAEEIKKTVNLALGEGSAFLVDVVINAANDIVVTIDDDKSVDVEMCEKLHRDIEAAFDRDKEDYSLEVGSAGLTAPLTLPRQYRKNIGGMIEVLTCGGKKIQGELKSVGDEGFSIAITRKIKPEGAKRKIDITEEAQYLYTDVKYVKNLIIFK